MPPPPFPCPPPPFPCPPTHAHVPAHSPAHPHAPGARRHWEQKRRETIVTSVTFRYRHWEQKRREAIVGKQRAKLYRDNFWRAFYEDVVNTCVPSRFSLHPLNPLPSVTSVVFRYIRYSCVPSCFSWCDTKTEYQRLAENEYQRPPGEGATKQRVPHRQRFSGRKRSATADNGLPVLGDTPRHPVLQRQTSSFDPELPFPDWIQVVTSV